MIKFTQLPWLLIFLSSNLSYAIAGAFFNSTKISLLEKFLAHHPRITYVTPSSTNYTAERETYAADNPAVPLAIVRPQNAEDIAALVSFSKINDVDFVVRSGGHDLYGRSEVNGALTIDMRDINSVEAFKNESVAKIGGGILMVNLATKLSKYDLVTAFGSVASVGYVGWSSYGGYGSFSAHYGLGVDQIVGATIVNVDGEVVEANPAVVKGIRGAGGNFGVIVELTIKVLAGVIFYHDTNISTAFKQYARGYNRLKGQGLPAALGVQPIVAGTPPLGKQFGVEFVWSSSDQKEGRVYLDKIAALGKVITNTVIETTVPEWITESSALVLPSVYGGDRTVSVRQLTEQVNEIIGKNIDKIPSDSGTAFSIHECRGPSARPNPQSVFGSREPHFVIELIGSAANPANLNATQAWAATFREELLRSSPANLLPGTYISLTQPGDTPLSKIYGPNYQTLLALKREFDPQDVFNLAVPSLSK
ncbi:hypothetical protein MMC22_003121 [Lobaria immixta]|nr:hypothetical protein [Lobaria immixta]